MENLKLSGGNRSYLIHLNSLNIRSNNSRRSLDQKSVYIFNTTSLLNLEILVWSKAVKFKITFWKKLLGSSCLSYTNYYFFNFACLLLYWYFLNPLSASPTKWSNTLKQFVGNLSTNCLSVFDHLVKLALEGLKSLHNIQLDWIMFTLINFQWLFHLLNQTSMLHITINR